jgi:hypothetical protein
MEMNRNQYLMLGIVVLFLGVQFRMIESFVLNAEASKAIAARIPKGEKSKEPGASVVPSYSQQSQIAAAGPLVALRTITPPDWLGWCCISVGAVLILHSLAMPRPS